MQPCFSLILPVYNVDKYLDGCMQSVLAQDFKDYEVILVDDGSTDHSPAICDAYAEKYAFVRAIHKPNGGLSSARNAGLGAAQGRYVWFVDSDDRIEHGALAILAKACENDPDIVKFNYIRSGAYREAVRCNVAAGDYPGAALMEKALRSGGKYVLSAWSHAYKREFLEKSGVSFVNEREIGSEDYLFNLLLLPKAKAVRAIETCLYDYALREGSITRKYREGLACQYALLRDCLLEGCEKKYAPGIHGFYIHHLIAGTCIPHEYHRTTQGHSLADGRKNVRAVFRSRDFRLSLKKCSRKGLPRNKKIQLLAMGLGIEPLFYYLHVVRPGRKK